MFFIEQGLPEEHGWQETYYHENSDSLVVRMRSFGRPTQESLWIKCSGDEKYSALCGQELSDFGPLSVLVDQRTHNLFCNVFVPYPIKDADGNEVDGYDWRSLVTIDLRSGDKVREIEEIAWDQRAWISDLLSCSQRDDRILASVAFEVRKDEGTIVVEYSICRLNPLIGDYVKLARLPGIFC